MEGVVGRGHDCAGGGQFSRGRLHSRVREDMGGGGTECVTGQNQHKEG